MADTIQERLRAAADMMLRFKAASFEASELYDVANTIDHLQARIAELTAALEFIRDARPVSLAPGLVSSPEELVVQMQARAHAVLSDPTTGGGAN